MATDPSIEFIKLQGERGELVRLATEAIEEAELAAAMRRGKARHLPPALLGERDRPGLERIDALLAGQLTGEAQE